MKQPPAHCHRFGGRPTNRRDLLKWCASGFGAIAMSALADDYSFGATQPPKQKDNPLAPKKPHFAAKAKNVIFLYMDGGPSQVDMFDYKPMLEKFHGQDPHKVIGKLAPTQFDAIGKVLKNQWKFKQHGESGQWISSLFPHLTEVDEGVGERSHSTVRNRQRAGS